MRYRVDLEFGYVSYDERDKQKAFDLYEERGVRIIECKDIFDEGVVIVGPPLYQDISQEIEEWDEEVNSWMAIPLDSRPGVN